MWNPAVAHLDGSRLQRGDERHTTEPEPDRLARCEKEIAQIALLCNPYHTGETNDLERGSPPQAQGLFAIQTNGDGSSFDTHASQCKEAV